MWIDLETLDAGGVAQLFVPDLREGEEQPLYAGERDDSSQGPHDEV